MKVFVTGGTGFIGSRLLRVLTEGGHRTRLLLRAEERETPPAAGVEAVIGDPMAEGPWWDAVAECDTAVNLAGYPVFSRWAARVKALIRESRIATTRNLVRALPQGRPFTLLNASGAGICGDCRERELDEDAPGGADFLSRVAQEWEAQALTGRERGARVFLARFGIVFGPGGGALPALVALFSQNVLPKRLLEAGFAFRFPELEAALRDILPGIVSPRPVTPG